MKEFLPNSHYLPIIAGLAAFFLSSSIYLYPVIINVSNIKGLMDTPNSRKVHTSNIPSLGGLGIFLAFSLSITVFSLLSNFPVFDLTKLIALISSAIILVFLGVKDDLTGMAPKKKFIGQLIAVCNVIFLTNVRILSFGGLFGVHELPYIVSVLFSVFVFVLVINALNLIDGIDGLAGSISVISSITFGYLFLSNGNYLMALTSFILVGSIFGFLKYNFSNDQKIFMGDCGSLLIGFLLSYQGIYFLNLNMEILTSKSFTNSPVILLAILSYPLFDLLRVFSLRIMEGRSPFSADSNHIHHRLLHLGLSHKRATLILVTANLVVIAFAFLTMKLNIHLHLLIVVLFGVTIYLLPFLKIFETSSIAQNANSNEVPVFKNEKNTFKVFSNTEQSSSYQDQVRKTMFSSDFDTHNAETKVNGYGIKRTKRFNRLKERFKDKKDKDSALKQ